MSGIVVQFAQGGWVWGVNRTVLTLIIAYKLKLHPGSQAGLLSTDCYSLQLTPLHTVFQCHAFPSVTVYIVCAQVVCTFGSMVFVTILLVRGIWSGVTYIRENRYSYIRQIDNDDNRWSRVQTAG